MADVLHVLPHRGGGAETYIDLIERLPGHRHARIALSTARTPKEAPPSLLARWPRVARAAARADLLHAHGELGSAAALPLLAARPAVWTTHGLHFIRRADGLARPVVRATTRAVIAATARTLCTSSAEAEELRELAGPRLAGRLAVAHNGIEPPPPSDPAERAAARAALGLAPEDVAAVFVGHLEARKGPLEAVRAAEAVRAGGLPVVLLVAGEGPLAGEVARHAGPAVRPLGFVRDVRGLLRAADVALLPSEREGLSFALLEGMAHGLATVVADGPGNPEALGDAGLVVPVGEPAALAGALRRLVADPAARARLGRLARERVGREFTVGNLLVRVSDAYAAALGSAA